ncbi:MAG: Uma2 family endonuclease, partial [Coleofasciculus sp. C2-GNP5-27]
DWFGVVGVPRLYEGRELRLSYVVWQELVSPFVVVEFLSPGTEAEDFGRTVQQPGNPPTKWHVYEQILRIPYYIIFSRYTNQLHAFHLVGGHYEPIELTEQRVPISELGLSLGLWQGNFREINRLWLRWFDASGALILMPSEEAAAAEQRALAAEQRAEQLAARLRELGLE